jgi:tRNA G18 (ribose-2'-O)-methylase SpoU
MASFSATTDDDAIDAPRASTPCSSIYILLENPSKSNNLGPLLRCANAFGTVAIVAIGFPKCAVEGKEETLHYSRTRART